MGLSSTTVAAKRLIRPLVPATALAILVGAGCGDDGGGAPIDAAVDGGTIGDADAGSACRTGTPEFALVQPTIAGDSPAFPSPMPPEAGGLPPFLWGTATAPHQVEGGNVNSDWWAWEQMPGRIADGDLSDDGPNHWDLFEADLDLMQSAGMNAYRMGIEWAKIFPSRAAFDGLTPDADAVAHYHAVLAAMRDRDIVPMVTIHHFVSPAWWSQVTGTAAERSVTGFASDHAVSDFTRWATWVADEFGGEVDLWVTINEPMVLVLAGFIAGQFPPGLIYDSSTGAALRAVRNMIFAHAAAYDALHAADLIDADGDGEAALVSIAKHQRVFFGADPCSEVDRRAAAGVEYLNNQLFLNAIIKGDLDGNGDGDLDDEEDARAHPDLIGRADYLGINYYSLSTVDGRVPLGTLSPGLPNIVDLLTGLPRTDLGWAIYPGGFQTVLEDARTYGLPIYVTENGIADQGDTMRSTFLVEHLHVLAQAIASGIDVRGYFHWSMMDNFEWVEGYCPHFGLYYIDTSDSDRARMPTTGAGVYRDIIAAGRVTAAMVGEHSTYGAAVACE